MSIVFWRIDAKLIQYDDDYNVTSVSTKQLYQLYQALGDI